MKTKLLIPILLFLVTLAAASAFEMCGSQKEINQNCTMMTNVVTGCAQYNYSIFNATSGESVESADLTALSGDIYQFNITEPAGDYIIKLCSGFTREIKVKEKDDTMLAAAVILAIVLGVVAWYSRSLPQEWVAVRFVMFIFAMILIMGELSLGLYMFVPNSQGYDLFNIILSNYYYFLGFLGLIIGIYYLISELKKYNIKQIQKGEADGNDRKSF